jgi:hypothetical protein
MVPEAAEQGAVVRIEGDNLPTTAASPIVRLVRVGLPEAPSICDANPPRTRDVTAAFDGAAVVFAVPLQLPFGGYHVCVVLTESATILMPPPGTKPFRVQHSAAVVVAAVTPATVYADTPTRPAGLRIQTAETTAAKGRPHYRFWVDGAGFSPLLTDNVILVDGHAEAATVVGGANVNPAEPRQLLVSIPFDGSLAGRHDIQVRVDQQESEPRSVLFSWRGRGAVRWWAFISTAVIFACLLGLIVFGLRRQRLRLGVFQALFLENGAYSLGKLQFYAWTGTALFGYFFLAMARFFVQGASDLPDVPEGLPGIVGISGATGVAGIAAGTLWGGKGPAGPEPSLADLIMTGGVVAADRVQFLAWTFASTLAFLVAVVIADPGTIETLPRIPEGLLWLSGLSGAGYLGGKVARGSAPAINETSMAIDGELVGAFDLSEGAVLMLSGRQFSLMITGRHLSMDAQIEVDNHRLGPPKSGSVLTRNAELKGESPEPGRSGYFQRLTVKFDDSGSVILSPDGKNEGRDLPLALVNPDGQSAKGILSVPSLSSSRADVNNQGVWQRRFLVP